jgi:hypothetical protein
MPIPLFIVPHARVNKKHSRIASSMQNFSCIVQCDAFMPHILTARSRYGEAAKRINTRC